ncbi:AAA family ATPase [Bdellovibrionota bacterium FG-2]
MYGLTILSTGITSQFLGCLFLCRQFWSSHNTNYAVLCIIQYHRSLAELAQESKKSVLLLGPLQCGKSTLIRGFEPDLTINLARESTFLEFSSNPAELEERLKKIKPKTVFIDEIQRLPSMLNTIQAILDETADHPKFFLTGSSARKLKRGHANLLPGRIRVYQMSPLYWEEFGEDVPAIQDLLATGTLPGILSEDWCANAKRLFVITPALIFKKKFKPRRWQKTLKALVAS